MLIQTHLADELDSRRRDLRGDPLQGGPGGGLAGPLHARAGARGHLRGAHVRRSGSADSHGGAGGGVRPGPAGGPQMWSDEAAQHPPGRAARGARAPGLHARLLERAAQRLIRAPGVPGGQRAGAGRDHASVSAAGGRAVRRRATDEDPRAGGIRSLLSRRCRTTGAAASVCAPRRPPAWRRARWCWPRPSACSHR